MEAPLRHPWRGWELSPKSLPLERGGRGILSRHVGSVMLAISTKCEYLCRSCRFRGFVLPDLPNVRPANMGNVLQPWPSNLSNWTKMSHYGIPCQLSTIFNHLIRFYWHTFSMSYNVPHKTELPRGPPDSPSKFIPLLARVRTMPGKEHFKHLILALASDMRFCFFHVLSNHFQLKLPR